MKQIITLLLLIFSLKGMADSGDPCTKEKIKKYEEGYKISIQENDAAKINSSMSDVEKRTAELKEMSFKKILLFCLQKDMTEAVSEVEMHLEYAKNISKNRIDETNFQKRFKDLKEKRDKIKSELEDLTADIKIKTFQRDNLLPIRAAVSVAAEEVKRPVQPTIVVCPMPPALPPVLPPVLPAVQVVKKDNSNISRADLLSAIRERGGKPVAVAKKIKPEVAPKPKKPATVAEILAAEMAKKLAERRKAVVVKEDSDTEDEGWK